MDSAGTYLITDPLRGKVNLGTGMNRTSHEEGSRGFQSQTKDTKHFRNHQN